MCSHGEDLTCHGCVAAPVAWACYLQPISTEKRTEASSLSFLWRAFCPTQKAFSTNLWGQELRRVLHSQHWLGPPPPVCTAEPPAWEGHLLEESPLRKKRKADSELLRVAANYLSLSFLSDSTGLYQAWHTQQPRPWSCDQLPTRLHHLALALCPTVHTVNWQQ